MKCILLYISLSSEGAGSLIELKQVEPTNAITKWNTRIFLSFKVPEIIQLLINHSKRLRLFQELIDS